MASGGEKKNGLARVNGSSRSKPSRPKPKKPGATKQPRAKKAEPLVLVCRAEPRKKRGKTRK